MSTLETRFKSAMRRLATTVNIITCESENTRYGITATAVTALSADPLSLLVCINRSSSLCPIIQARGLFCVNILSEQHAELSRAFGGALKGDERFTSGKWRASPEGLPWLADAQANLICEVDTVTSYGTHNVFFGRVRDIYISGEINPLIYGDGRYCKVA